MKPPFEIAFNWALLLEDEPNLAISLKIALSKLGIPVRQATTLKDAAKLIEQELPDFILLDRTLPDGDGIVLCDSLRKQNYTGSILVLTASGQTHERVQGLNLGADDYLAKPFSWEELEARILALARRKNLTASQPHVTSPSDAKPTLQWILDSDRLRVLGPKGWTPLTPLEFKLASKLIEAQGSIVSREELLKDVWGFTLLPKTRTVDHFLGRLRKHFENDPETPRYFLTVRGAGYRFEG